MNLLECIPVLYSSSLSEICFYGNQINQESLHAKLSFGGYDYQDINGESSEDYVQTREVSLSLSPSKENL
jgi:hypothetical protein